MHTLRMRIILRALFALLLVSAAASAEGFNYTNVEGGYSRFAPGDGNSYEGGYIAGMYELSGALHEFSVAGSYTRNEHSGVSIDSTLLGFNYHHSLTGSLDFIGDAFYENDSASAFGTSSSESGYALDAGVRTRLGEGMDLDILAGHSALTDSSASFLQLAGLYEFAPHWNVSIGWAHDSDAANRYNVGLRYEF